MAKYIIDIPESFVLCSPLKGEILGIPLSLCASATQQSYTLPTEIKLEPYTEPDIYPHTDNPTGWELYQDYQKAKERYETWKKQMNEIHVGDEVENASHKKGIVLNHYISPSSGLEYVRVLYMDDDGNSFISAWEKNNVCKTGRHFDEVEELLKKIGSEE